MREPDEQADASDPLEPLLAEALSLRDAGDDDAIARLLAAQPQHAERLREALGDLRRLDGLGTATPTPTRFGEFRILDRLGEGGMGIVYRAEQTSLGREVALKVVRPELLLFEGARERFRREIDAVARLQHPAIVPVLATGVADGIPWYAMPRLRGQSAESVVRQLATRSPCELRARDLAAVLGSDTADSPPSGADAPWWRVVVGLVHAAALGIQHAHQRGVLHRDLKPSNVMLTTDGRAVVLDFGLAQARGDDGLTQTGAAAGSPAYMAPEQVRGEAADERTDVYGLGATLHCLLDLRPPFAVDAPETLRQRILTGERQLQRVRTGAPPELLLVIDTALDVERGRRYASAGAFAADLAAVLAGGPIAARRLPGPVRLRRFAARHRALTAAVAVALGFAAAAPPVLLWQQRQANDALSAEASRTAAANQALREAAVRADRSTEASLDAIESLLGSLALPKLRNLPAVQSVAAGLLDDALRLFDRLAGDDTHRARVRTLRHRTLFDIAQMATMLGHNDKAKAVIERLLSDLTDADGALGGLLRGRAHRLLAWIDLRGGNHAASAAHVTAARTAFASLAGSTLANIANRDLADVAEIACGIADACGDREGTLRAARERVAILEQFGGGPDDIELRYAKLALGANLRDAGDRDAARPLLQQCVDAPFDSGQREVGWPVPRLVHAMALHELGSLAYDERRYATAADLAEQALRGFDALVRDYPDDLSVRRHRGRTANLAAAARNTLGHSEKALPLLEQAIADQQFVLQRQPDDHTASRYLGQHYRTLLVSLRTLQDWTALATAARALGALGGSDNQGRAARDLLRCATHASGAQRTALCDDALTLLAAAVSSGLRIDADDAVFRPVLDDPRFEALLKDD